MWGAQLLIIVGFTVSAFAQPKIQAVVNAGNGGKISFYSLVTIWGQNLSAAPVTAAVFPWPTTLGDSQVSFCDASGNGQGFCVSKSNQCAPAQLTYVSPTQINAVLPASPGNYLWTFTASAKVTRGGMTDTFPVTINEAAPGFFRMGFDCAYPASCAIAGQASAANSINRGSIIDQRGVLVSSQNPIRVGQIYSAYVTGIGGAFPPFVSIGTAVNGDGRCCDGIGMSQYPGLGQINFSLAPDLRRVFGDGENLPKCQSITADISTELLITVQGGLPADGSDQVSIPVFIGKNELLCAQ